MTATYTYDIFSTLDGYGSFGEGGDWGGYWGKQGPEFLDRRRSQWSGDLRVVFGATTFREFAEMLGPEPDLSGVDEWLHLFRSAPATVVSSTLTEPLGWPNATIERGDAADIVATLKAQSDVPIRSHGSISLNMALMAAGLVDFVQVTVFPVISGQTGDTPVFGGARDFDLALVESAVLDGNTQELVYRPTRHHHRS